ncbi:phage tail protein [Coleofasciculus sp. FACHB-64]|uniref:phage tail protein n=1 Tax=Cyanophyceae TaxID=3028117 RepID=UPI00168A11A4|nr:MULTISPECIES: phage tail protein [unclassified Coleofasciculus]MBD1838439.1 phage tail protein [Coleofasciculus sp. FACHB-501]MBD1880839.1 phage tail protein [Coleofasciculus sp. FACHB-T130]MBD1891385.1 phage tail protein [Coleofasciculus sp. FACHB-SPT9]MBD1897115.1 phage tail protein [Coleofasciculus sp. FACHB-129]MBD1901038.1 phage tail protein [Coleofasciculus sp. FACHB-125]
MPAPLPPAQSSASSRNNGQNKNGTSVRELNYVTANRFYVEIQSNITACFTECQGLGVTIKAQKHYEGGVNDQQRIFLGQAEFSDVTLKRGITNDLVFWDWISKILSDVGRNQGNNLPKKERRNINILVFNPAGETMQCWTLIGAVPVAWKSASLSADSNAVAIEELTLSYESLQVDKSRNGGSSISGGRDSLGYFA